MTVKDSVVYVGTTGGIYVSLDKGQHWERLQRGINSQATSLITLGNGLLAGTESDGGSPAGLYRSTNSGKSWEFSGPGIPNGEGIGFITEAVQSVFAATTYSGKLYRSTDAGYSWTRVQQGLPTNAQINGLHGNTSGILVQTNQGMFRSNQDGDQWTRIDIEFLPNTQEDLFPASPTSIGNRLFVGTNGQGVWASDDGGVSWIHASNGLPGNAFIGKVKAVGDTLYCTTASGALYQSTDQGKSWQVKDRQFALGRNPEQFVKVGASLLAASFDGGGILCSTDDGATWETSNAGLNAAEVFAMNTFGNQLYVASAGGVWMTDDKGATWGSVNNGLAKAPLRNLDACALGSNGTTIFAGIYRDGLYRTTKAGSAWERVMTGLPETCSPYVIKTIGQKIYLGTFETGAFISEDEGTSWKPIATLPQDISYSDFASKEGKLYAASYGAGMFSSDDSGATWRVCKAGLQSPFVNTINTDSAQVMIGTDEGIYRGVGNGWVKLNLPILVNGGVTALTQFAGAMHAATYGQGILISNDNGETWTPSNNGLSTQRFYSIATTPYAIYLGSSGAGISMMAFLPPASAQ